MKKIFTLLVAITMIAYISQGQDAWTKKVDFGGAPRVWAVGFSIGNKGYLGTGASGQYQSISNKDFWEYDPATDIWTQKASLDTGRVEAFGFSIGNKGYIGMGQIAGVGYVNDFWEYDPFANIWTKKANYLGGPSQNQAGFSIGTKGYVGTGWNGWSFLKDFWEYDQATDTWTKKVDFPGTARDAAVGFSIGNKGYIGTGGLPNKNDFWEYDPATDIWTKKANFGGTPRNKAKGFSINGKGYIGTGYNGSNQTKDFWEYDPATDTWTKKADFPGTAREGGVGFSIGNTGYIGIGASGTYPDYIYYKDFWEYTPENPANPQNTSYGTNALSSNSSGLYNAAFGYYSLYKNTTGNNNSAFGYYSLYSNTSGNSNIAFGSQALYSNTIGIENTALGTFALLKNISGSQNTANGTNALYANTTGSYNTAYGVSALASNKTGSNNTASGYSALTSNTTGTANTATGYLALSENTTGRGNTGMGWSVLSNNTTGTYNTALGNNANVSVGDLTNSTAIGRASLITASNQVRIGNSSVTSIGGYTGWSNISDGRYKENLKENVPGLEFINALRPVTYNLKVTELDGFLRRDMRKTGKNNESLSQQTELDKKATAEKERIIYTGFVAQEVEKAAKGIGYDFSGIDAPKNDHDVYALRYAEFVVPLVKAVQQLSQKNAELKNELAEIKKLLMLRTPNNVSMLQTNIDEKLSVTVSPNPVRSVLNISIKGNCIRPVITILDMYGKAILVKSLTQNQTKLDVSKLTAGTYMIKITDADGKQLHSGKFIRQN